jgi:hypothetical protein
MRPVSLSALSGHLSEQNCSLSFVSSRLPIGKVANGHDRSCAITTSLQELMSGMLKERTNPKRRE